MAWNWNESGRIDSYEFEKIAVTNLDKSYGKVDGFITSGTINYSYYSDLKVSGSLEVIAAAPLMQEQEYLIRVWYTPELNGETKRIELGTFYYTADMHYENGIYKGTIDLRSTLARHIDDVTVCKWTLAKGKKVSDLYKAVFKSLGGFPKIEGIKDVTLKQTHIFDTGTSPMEILQYLADACGGEIAVNTHGQTVLRPYTSPKNKAKSIKHNLTANAQSVILSGFDIQNSYKETPNRVVCVYEEGSGDNTVQYTGVAALNANENRSYQKIGKWVTQYYKVTECKAPFAANLKKQAANHLVQLNSANVYFTFSTYYQPIEAGEVIKFTYDNFTETGIINSIDLDLSVGGLMQVKIRRI